ncbi:MAG: polysaccharide pyruvyl transferase family protein [Thermoguttaceae bacterium]|jgi:colanic acid/amylovoran biosynthesis protein|nr:polysaccharide pyruvyl transferase family protein [Thermoguttaceae bacterium]
MILLRGTSVYNKGAELMAVAVLEHFRSRFGAPEFAVSPQFGPYRHRARYGLWSLLHARRYGRSKLAIKLMNPAMRRSYGLAREDDLDAVLDASGFAFGDQHGPGPTQTMADDCRRWKRQGKKIVLLPQAFGPFSSPEIRTACRAMLDHCDLVYARDETSYRHLTDAVGACDRVRMAPDFTGMVSGRLPAGFRPAADVAFVVPNQRMLDKTDEATRARYVPFLATVIDVLAGRGLCPVVLLHAPEDTPLATRLAETTPTRFDVLSVACPVELKGVLGTGHLVVASRFHALVSALSQRVPSLATGWSHKYRALLDDYECPECLLSVMAQRDAIESAVARLIEPNARAALIARLSTAAEKINRKTRAMWDEVDAVLGIDQNGRP